MLVALVLTMLVADVFAADNQIYITQTNATNSQIDIEQLGSGNLVADNASATGTVDAAMNINGTGLNFNLDQRGDANWFLTDLNGNDGTYTFEFIGNTNKFIGQLNSAGTYSMNDMNFNSVVTGGTNTFTVNIAEDDNAGDADIDWIFDGSDNTVDFNVASDYTNARIAALIGNNGVVAGDTADSIVINWDIDGSNNEIDNIVNSSHVVQDWDITGSYNKIDYAGLNYEDASAGDGHYSKVELTGSYWDMKLIQQSAEARDWLRITATGDGTAQSNATLCIVQSDAGTSATC